MAQYVGTLNQPTNTVSLQLGAQAADARQRGIAQARESAAGFLKQAQTEADKMGISVQKYMQNNPDMYKGALLTLMGGDKQRAEGSWNQLLEAPESAAQQIQWALNQEATNIMNSGGSLLDSTKTETIRKTIREENPGLSSAEVEKLVREKASNNNWSGILFAYGFEPDKVENDQNYWGDNAQKQRDHLIKQVLGDGYSYFDVTDADGKVISKGINNDPKAQERVFQAIQSGEYQVQSDPAVNEDGTINTDFEEFSGSVPDLPPDVVRAKDLLQNNVINLSPEERKQALNTISDYMASQGKVDQQGKFVLNEKGEALGTYFQQLGGNLAAVARGIFDGFKSGMGAGGNAAVAGTMASHNIYRELMAESANQQLEAAMNQQANDGLGSGEEGPTTRALDYGAKDLGGGPATERVVETTRSSTSRGRIGQVQDLYRAATDQSPDIMTRAQQDRLAGEDARATTQLKNAQAGQIAYKLANPDEAPETEFEKMKYRLYEKEYLNYMELANDLLYKDNNIDLKAWNNNVAILGQRMGIRPINMNADDRRLLGLLPEKEILILPGIGIGLSSGLTSGASYSAEDRDAFLNQVGVEN
jgi:hypothetical protein